MTKNGVKHIPLLTRVKCADVRVSGADCVLADCAAISSLQGVGPLCQLSYNKVCKG
jgi:hypothetical protein